MFVRWMGAFVRCHDLAKSAEWELSQTAREVAAEPLYRGRSLLLAEDNYDLRIKVGLVIDEVQSHFRVGYFRDCYSGTDRKTGALLPKRSSPLRKPIRDMDRFRKAWNGFKPFHHGEVFFDLIVARAVAARKGDKEAESAGRDLAKRLSLPLILVESHDMSK